MGVRVRLRIVSVSGGEVVSPALVRTGFEARTPQLLIPRTLAEKLRLWPPPRNSIPIEVRLLGVSTRGHIIPKALDVYVLTSDRVVDPVKCDAVVSESGGEVLISDYLAEELKIAILAPKTGLWRFVDEDRVRVSEAPQHWL